MEIKKETGAVVTIAEEQDRQNLLNAIARNISKSSCTWCPLVTKELYEKSLSKSLQRYSILKKGKVQKTTVKVSADILPIGHFLQKIPKFYHPEKGWFLSPEYIVDNNQWVENPIIIGYNVKSSNQGMHVRFKIRKPIQNIKIYKDARLIERGSVCNTRPKPYLLNLCKKLMIKINPKYSIEKICSEIKARLMYLELLERSKGTCVKFFYTQFEMS